MENSLQHYGILGMHWGVRRYQNYDGSLTSAGKSRLSKKDTNVLNALDKKDVVTIFPPITSRTSTVQVLKAPKTQTSTRKIFLPRTVAEMLADWKRKQDAAREMLGLRMI